MSLAEMREWAQVSGQGLVEWATRAQPADTVQVNWEGTPTAVPCTIILTQAIIHAAEHRTQDLSVLTHLEIETPDLSAWEFFREAMT